VGRGRADIYRRRGDNDGAAGHGAGASPLVLRLCGTRQEKKLWKEEVVVVG